MRHLAGNTVRKQHEQPRGVALVACEALPARADLGRCIGCLRDLAAYRGGAREASGAASRDR
eukprot:3422275-Alexandrium_andersonii.AAC.1